MSKPFNWVNSDCSGGYWWWKIDWNFSILIIVGIKNFSIIYKSPILAIWAVWDSNFSDPLWMIFSSLKSKSFPLHLILWEYLYPGSIDIFQCWPSLFWVYLISSMIEIEITWWIWPYTLITDRKSWWDR